MMELPKRKINRLQDFDYSAPNAYFITICTAGRRNIFWNNPDKDLKTTEEIIFSEYGKLVLKYISDIHNHYSALSVDYFTIMPNHLHLLIKINTDKDGRPINAPTISNVVKQLKGKILKEIGYTIWQKGFYDHVIRNQDGYNDIREYIQSNPLKWVEDKLYKE